MVINRSMSGFNSNKILANNSNAISKLQESQKNIASGRKQDAFGAAAIVSISEKLLAQHNGLSTASENLQNANSMLQAADGALSSSNEILARMGELANSASNGILTGSDRAAYAKEFDALKAELGDIGAMKFNDSSLFGGGAKTIAAGANSGDNMRLELSNMDLVALGLIDVDISTLEGAQGAISSVGDAQNYVIDQRTTLGATQNAMNHRLANMAVSAENQAAAESSMRDVDIAAEASKGAAAGIRVQAGLAMQSQANAVSANVLNLLQF